MIIDTINIVNTIYQPIVLVYFYKVKKNNNRQEKKVII